MKLTLLCVGKTDNKHLENLLSEYTKRLSKFIRFQIEYIVPRNTSKLQPNEMKRAEGSFILQKTEKADFIVLLDEQGVTYTSQQFAKQLQKYMNAGYRHIVFVVGGAYGFSDEVYNKADAKLSLSKMTTTHQLIRLFFTEQLYRAFTILKGHPYHNN
jgi:23S rRNA (pseudouridine1915-N3)-methyltransferase